jgi:hypothetical protein
MMTQINKKVLDDFSRIIQATKKFVDKPTTDLESINWIPEFFNAQVCVAESNHWDCPDGRVLIIWLAGIKSAVYGLRNAVAHNNASWIGAFNELRIAVRTAEEGLESFDLPSHRYVTGCSHCGDMPDPNNPGLGVMDQGTPAQ